MSIKNIEVLRGLYEIHAPSMKEKKIRNYLKHKIVTRGATYQQDGIGNLLVTKGKSDTYPCVVAHLDQVQMSHPKDFRTIIFDDTIIGRSDKHKQQYGLGADDKNGIWIALNCLERFDNIKVAFFVGEEVGCVGSSQVDLDFFKDCRFIIEPDRRGGSDLITMMSGIQVCSNEFIQDIPYLEYGYREEQGSFTDILTLLERGVGISCLNLSCGYYHPHTDSEITVLSELENCQRFVFDIIENCTKTYPYEYKNPYALSDKEWLDMYYSEYVDEYNYNDWDSWYDYEKKNRYKYR